MDDTTKNLVDAVLSLATLLTVLAAVFQASVTRGEDRWEQGFVRRRSVRLTAVLIFVVLGCIIILGRLIAYDHIWGHLSPATKA